MPQVIPSLENQDLRKNKDSCDELMVLLHHLIDNTIEYYMVKYFEHLTFSDHATKEMVIYHQIWQFTYTDALLG